MVEIGPPSPSAFMVAIIISGRSRPMQGPSSPYAARGHEEASIPRAARLLNHGNRPSPAQSVNQHPAAAILLLARCHESRDPLADRLVGLAHGIVNEVGIARRRLWLAVSE